GILLLAATLGAIAGILTTFPEIPLYQATSTIEIEAMNNNFLNMRDLNPTATSGWDQNFDIQTQIREMQSHTVMDRVNKRMNSINPAQVAADPVPVSAWRKALHLNRSSLPTAAEAIDSMRVSIKPALASRIVEITCDS